MTSSEDTGHSLFSPPPAGAWDKPHRFFQAKNYGPMEHTKLTTLAASAERVQRNPSLLDGLSPHSKRYRQRAKQHILELVEELNTILPMQVDDIPLAENIAEIRTGAEPEIVAARVEQVKGLITQTMRQMAPPPIPAGHNNVAMMNRQDLSQHLKYMREIFDAVRAEQTNSHMHIIPDSQLMRVSREIHTTLALGALLQELDKTMKPYQKSVGRPNTTSDRAALDVTAQRCIQTTLNQFNQKFTGKALRSTALAYPKNHERSPQDPSTVGEVLQTMQSATTMEPIQICAQQLHYFVARRAYFFQADLAHAYAQDYQAMNQTVGRRRGRDERIPNNPFHHHEEPIPNNPFHHHEEPIRAGYEALWCQTAQTVLTLIKDFEITLKDTDIASPPGTKIRTGLPHSGGATAIRIGDEHISGISTRRS